jgi:hypothetical protein
MFNQGQNYKKRESESCDVLGLTEDPHEVQILRPWEAGIYSLLVNRAFDHFKFFIFFVTRAFGQ